MEALQLIDSTVDDELVSTLSFLDPTDSTQAQGSPSGITMSWPMEITCGRILLYGA